MTGPGPHPASPWWFRLAALAAAAPLLAAVAVTALVFEDDETVQSTSGAPPGNALTLADRWHAVQTFGQTGWPGVLTALACLVLALAAVSGRPRRLAPPESPAVLTGLADVCGAWAAGTTALTAWLQLSQRPQEAGGVSFEVLLHQWALDTGLGLFATAVAAAVVLWCRRPGSDEGVVEDAGERARAQ